VSLYPAFVEPAKERSKTNSEHLAPVADLNAVGKEGTDVAKRVVLVDDIDGGDADETVAFGLDGESYEIDLSKKNAAAFRQALADYIAAARRSESSPAPAPAPAATNGVRTPYAPIDREQAAAIRTWARKKGHDVSDRGRIPSRLVELYNNSR
jgi:nucleoid-associated protein Lsr2